MNELETALQVAGAVVTSPKALAGIIAILVYYLREMRGEVQRTRLDFEVHIAREDLQHQGNVEQHREIKAELVRLRDK